MTNISRRHFLQTTGALGAGALLPSMTFGKPLGNTVRDRLWVWAIVEGAFKDNYGNFGLPNNGDNRMTPIQAAEFLDIPNSIFIRLNNMPAPPYDEYITQYRNVERLMWSFVGDGGRTTAAEQEHVLELARKTPNVTGLFMDDFFKGNATPAETASRLWLAQNNVALPVIVTFRFENPVEADSLELEQSAWKHGSYLTSDVAVDLRDGNDWKEHGNVRLEDRPNAKASLALPGKGMKELRLRLLGTHDTDGAHSVGLSGVRFLKNGSLMDISKATVEASSTFPGHPPENLLLNAPSSVEPEARAAVTVARLREIKEKMAQMDRKLDLGVVLYTFQLNPAIRGHIDLCDIVSFWSWTTADLLKLPENFAKYREIVPDKRTLLGIYMWDFGSRKPYPLDVMKMQCDLGLKWLKEGKIEGMIFTCTNLCDMGIEAVEWSKRWIAEHGKEKIS